MIDEALQKAEFRRLSDGWWTPFPDEFIKRVDARTVSRPALIWFWLKADARSALIWRRMWLPAILVCAVCVYWRQPIGLIVAWAFLRGWITAFTSSVRATWARPMSGIVRTFKPAQIEQYVIAEIDGSPLQLWIDRELASALAREWPAIEVHYFLDRTSAVLMRLREWREPQP